LLQDYNDEIRQEQMREIQLMNAGSGGVISSPASSEAAVAAAAAAATLAGANVGKVVSPRCPQPAPGMILHPALRELGRAQTLIPAATSEFIIVYLYNGSIVCIKNTLKQIFKRTLLKITRT
jgi:hypothetical protein